MIERMTSSIVINANLSQADQAELQQLIASAVGYDNDRGDQIAIQGFDFAQAEVDPAADPQGNEPIAAAKGYLKYAIIGGIVLTLFLVILMIVGVIRRRRKEDELEVDVTEEMVTFAQPSAVSTGASPTVAQEVVLVVSAIGLLKRNQRRQKHPHKKPQQNIQENQHWIKRLEIMPKAILK